MDVVQRERHVGACKYSRSISVLAVFTALAVWHLLMIAPLRKGRAWGSSISLNFQRQNRGLVILENNEKEQVKCPEQQGQACLYVRQAAMADIGKYMKAPAHCHIYQNKRETKYQERVRNISRIMNLRLTTSTRLLLCVLRAAFFSSSTIERPKMFAGYPNQRRQT